MENSVALKAKILTVSDGVVVGEREDISGGNLQKLLEESGWVIMKRAVEHRQLQAFAYENASFDSRYFLD